MTKAKVLQSLKEAQWEFSQQQGDIVDAQRSQLLPANVDTLIFLRKKTVIIDFDFKLFLFELTEVKLDVFHSRVWLFYFLVSGLTCPWKWQGDSLWTSL